MTRIGLDRIIVLGTCVLVLVVLVVAHQSPAQAQGRRGQGPPPFGVPFADLQEQIDSLGSPLPTIFTIPHFTLEIQPFPLDDTVIFATYTGGLADGGAPVGASFDLYVYNRDTGQPLQSMTGANVCNPCSFVLGSGAANDAAPRTRTLSITQLIQAAGGLNLFTDVTGFMQIVAGGDVANLAFDGTTAVPFSLVNQPLIFTPLP